MRESQADEIVTLLRSIDQRLAAVEAALAHPPMIAEAVAVPVGADDRAGGVTYVDKAYPVLPRQYLRPSTAGAMKPAAGG